MYSYDFWDNLTKVVDAKSQATEYEYDGRGRLTREVSPCGDLPTGRFGTEYVYAPILSPAVTKLRKPNVWNGSSVEYKDLVYEYDTEDRATKVDRPGAEADLAFEYSFDGRLTRSTDDLSGVAVGDQGDTVDHWRFDYGADGRMTHELLRTGFGNAVGEQWWQFDAAARRTKATIYSPNVTRSYAGEGDLFIFQISRNPLSVRYGS